jgi:hypothetical protein
MVLISLVPFCHEYNSQIGLTKMAIISSIQALGALYYLVLAALGFRNIYWIFYKQGKLEAGNFIFPLLYLFTQSICLIQACQCLFFIGLNTQLQKYCGSSQKFLEGDRIELWASLFSSTLAMLPYITAMKGCIGCVQMAQLTELSVKLKILLEQMDIATLQENRRRIFLVMLASMIIPSIILCGVTQYDISTLWQKLDFSGTVKFYESMEVVRQNY